MAYDYGVIIHPDEISKYWNLMLLSSGIKTMGIHPAGGTTALESLEKSIEMLKNPDIIALLSELNKAGINTEFEMHALSWLLPRHLFETHPKWFRQNESGERTADYNLCPSNKDALDYITMRASKLAQIFVPTTNKYYFWLDDMADSKCQCNECKKLTPSDASLLVSNAILRGIKQINPNAKQCYLAYHDTLNIPKCIEPEKGIFLEYAPMQRDLNIALNDQNSKKNISQTKPLDELLSFFGKADSKALDYWLDNSYHSNWQKPPKEFVLNKDVLEQDVIFYQEKGFQTLTCFACFLGYDYYELYKKYPQIDIYDEICHKHIK